MSCVLDHLVIAAASLEQGAAWCEDVLGVAPGPGGRHPLMGTHNRLLKLGPGAYLEIIATDPQAPRPARTRWFGLDDAALQRSLTERGPRLLHWVAGTRMLDMLRWGLVTAGFDVGETVSASRETPGGLLQWRIVVRDDGRLLCAGALPTLIEWRGAHPADAMPESGVALKSLAVGGLPAAASSVLRAREIALAGPGAPALRAVLETPRGAVALETHE